ncbi:hypothetical protein [Lentzea albida]|uniref:Helix-turn-helix domain-containing protein n=1 Tax=Lentzea albida TaxID=65499 RepID=A0A1H9NNX6_9PSEU|nr:hypothetical protein [Lentzea albida]SER37591.1 hypothetical protein SAMN04488000_108249 [Lentzea albida]
MSPSEDDSPFATACRARNHAEFICALNQLRLSRGLSFREVSINAGQFALAKSSAHAMCTDRPPKQEDKLRAFLTGCGEPAGALDGWVEQWRRVTASRANRRPHPAAQLVPSSARGFSPPE